MSWLKLCDTFAIHPKTCGLSNEAFRLHVCTMTECRRLRRDGTIAKVEIWQQVRLSGGRRFRWKKAVAELAEAGLWQEQGDHYIIHDWLGYQPSVAQDDAERERKRANKAAYDARQKEALGLEDGSKVDQKWLATVPQCGRNADVSNDQNASFWRNRGILEETYPVTESVTNRVPDPDPNIHTKKNSSVAISASVQDPPAAAMAHSAERRAALASPPPPIVPDRDPPDQALVPCERSRDGQASPRRPEPEVVFAAKGMTVAQVQQEMGRLGIRGAICGLPHDTLTLIKKTCADYPVSPPMIHKAWEVASGWSASKGMRSVNASCFATCLDGEMGKAKIAAQEQKTGDLVPCADTRGHRELISVKEQAQRRGIVGGIKLYHDIKNETEELMAMEAEERAVKT